MRNKKIYVPKFDKNGRAEVNPAYKEIFALYDMLEDSEIPFTLRRSFDGWQIIYPAMKLPSSEDIVVSVIEHYGSYGNREDLLEIMGLLTPDEAEQDSVVGYLTAKNVYARIRAYHDAHKED